jgi:hypothetical protein
VGIFFVFTNGTMLPPGQFLVLVENAERFAAKYPGVPIAGVYSGRLDNGGERLTLSHPLGGTILSVAYDDAAPWPASADHLGFSLVQKAAPPGQAPDEPAKWRASALPGGSPGADDPPQSIAPIVINEVLTASPADGFDVIELFNPTATNVDVGGWFLTDDPTEPGKFRIPDGTIIPALGYLVFDERQFNPTPGTNGSFALSGRGESVYLFSGAGASNFTGYAHGFSFDAAAVGVTFGRYVNSTGEEHFPAQITATFSHANSGPRVGPVVINEIHYHPAPDEQEFVELLCVAEVSVPLFDPAAPTNTWRLNGLAFTFPTNIVLDPGALLLLVPTNPPGFRARHSVPESVVILGPFSGALQNSGERLKLERPTPADTNNPAWIVVDEVRYNDKAPWPPAADGSGPSLQRIVGHAYGNDPINWAAAAPTPGQPNAFPQTDTDGDGLPDEWELTQGTNPWLPDADADPDGDGYTNAQEYLAGTHPLEPRSRLQVDEVRLGPDCLLIQFEAVAHRTYTLLKKGSLDDPIWNRVSDVPAQPTNRVVVVEDVLPADHTRFYRLVTPAAP